jgi:excisionase family DNA binding protein
MFMNNVHERPKETNSSVFLNVDELAKELGIGRAIVYRGLRDGTIPSLRVGKRFILPKAAINEWLRNAGGVSIA